MTLNRVMASGLALLRFQAVRYMLVGGFNTAFGFSFFAFQVLVLNVPYLAALAVSHVIGVSIAFYLYRRFVFNVQGQFWLDFFRCHGVYLVQLSISGTLLVILTELFGIPPVVAAATTTITTVTVSFFGHKYFSFRRPSLRGASAPHREAEATAVPGRPNETTRFD